MLNKTKLDNGLEIITYNDVNAKTVTLSFTIKCGSYDEDESNYGIAHFVEHMLFKGTSNMTSQEISQAIEGIGGILNAETTFEYTRYYCKVPAEVWHKGIQVLLDMILFNTIPEEEFNNEKQVVLEELKMYNDAPNSKIFDLLFKQLHPSYGNRHNIGGTIESVSKITREQMLAFIEKYYNYDNIVFIATGNIDHNKLVNVLQEYTDNIDLDSTNNQKQKFIPDKLGQEDLINQQEISQSHLCWGGFGPAPTDSDYITAEVAVTLLGGNSSSRLYQIIREQRGLAYTVSTDIELLSDASIITGYVGLDGTNIDSVKESIKTELNKLKNELVDNEELIRTKMFLQGTTLISQETTSGKTQFINCAVLNNLNIDVDEYLKDINSVTSEMILEFANKYFRDDNICFAQIIPK